MDNLVYAISLLENRSDSLITNILGRKSSICRLHWCQPEDYSHNKSVRILYHVTILRHRFLNLEKTDRKDLVPIIPPRFTGFHHESGEIHIEENGSFFACPGQDNDNSLCSTGDASSVLGASIEDHFGARLFDVRELILIKFPLGPYGDIKLDTNCIP